MAKVLSVTDKLYLAVGVSCKDGEALSIDDRRRVVRFDPRLETVIATHGASSGGLVRVQLPALGDEALVRLAAPVRQDWILRPNSSTGLWEPAGSPAFLCDVLALPLHETGAVRVRTKGSGWPGDIVAATVCRGREREVLPRDSIRERVNEPFRRAVQAAPAPPEPAARKQAARKRRFRLN